MASCSKCAVVRTHRFCCEQESSAWHCVVYTRVPNCLLRADNGLLLLCAAATSQQLRKDPALLVRSLLSLHSCQAVILRLRVVFCQGAMRRSLPWVLSRFQEPEQKLQSSQAGSHAASNSKSCAGTGPHGCSCHWCSRFSAHSLAGLVSACLPCMRSRATLGAPWENTATFQPGSLNAM